MANKKELILQAALQSFSGSGYHASSTKAIAELAGVSEALIFKYFKNKELLLEKVVINGYSHIVSQNRGLLPEKDPLRFIHKIIDIPYKLVKENPQFWKLQSRLIDVEIAKKQYDLFLKPVYPLLVKAFTDLGYKQPEKETRYILLLVESLWKFEIFKRKKDLPEMIEFIKTKYQKGKA